MKQAAPRAMYTPFMARRSLADISYPAHDEAGRTTKSAFPWRGFWSHPFLFQKLRHTVRIALMVSKNTPDFKVFLFGRGKL
jgi:hypothetical protein